MTAETADILRKARALVEKGWCQGHYAEGQSGRTVNWSSRSAVKVCAYGALLRITHEVNIAKAINTMDAIVGNLIAFNDREETTQADVLAAFNRAIAAESG